MHDARALEEPSPLILMCSFQSVKLSTSPFPISCSLEGAAACGQKGEPNLVSQMRILGASNVDKRKALASWAASKRLRNRHRRKAHKQAVPSAATHLGAACDVVPVGQLRITLLACATMQGQGDGAPAADVFDKCVGHLHAYDWMAQKRWVLKHGQKPKMVVGTH
eukprot:1142768-Pelagomonas_calceolata.AAC.7